MSRVVFKKLLIVDIGNKKAQCVEFKDGKNLLTSTNNHLGKSLICKSLYHSMGADVFFSDSWKTVNAVYSIEFKIDKNEYRITRQNSIFNIYDQQGNKLKFFKIKNLIDKLNELFDFKIMLVSREGETSFIASYPMYTYMPYYIDQENGWTPKAESFDRLAMLEKSQRITSLFYHLGCLDDEYIQHELKLKHLNERKGVLEKEREQCINAIEYMRAFIDKNGNVISNEGELNKKISSNKEMLNTSLNELEKLRNEIISLENEKETIIKEKETITSFIKKEKQIPQKTMDVLCPKCEHAFSISFEERFRKEYLLETINEDLSRIALSLAKIDEKLIDRNRKFVNIRNKLKLLELKITTDEDLYNLYIKTKSARSMIIDSTTRIGELDTEVNAIDKNIKELKNKIKIFDDKKVIANTHYKNNLSTMFAALNVSTSELQPNSYNIGADISVSGAYQERAILSKYYAFLQTKKQLANNIVRLPFVIDSPKGSEQSKENEKIIMDFVLGDSSLDNQIIIATIDGKEYLKENMNVNVIELTNPPHSLLTTACYRDNEKLITKILLDFS